MVLTDPNCRSLTWAHMGDLHITQEGEANYRDYLSITDAFNTHLAGQIDFCILPGDNADDGLPAQYRLIRHGLERLNIPVHVIPGDHDRRGGDLGPFYQGLAVERLPYAITRSGFRCLFLDVVSAGGGGPDFRLGPEQLRWVESELRSAASNGQSPIVFMHAYPADLKADGEPLHRLFRDYQVRVVDMGHTHYNELANDGATIFATTRSTGQIQEGPVGFSLVSVQAGVVSWRFKPLRSAWPLVMITSPADHRLITDPADPAHIVTGGFVVRARVFGAESVVACRCRIDDGPWISLLRSGIGWAGAFEAPHHQFALKVEASDSSGGIDTDSILVAVPGYRSPQRVADGSDADAIDVWPERHLLGTRLGPNRNGRHW